MWRHPWSKMHWFRWTLLYFLVKLKRERTAVWNWNFSQCSNSKNKEKIVYQTLLRSDCIFFVLHNKHQCAIGLCILWLCNHVIHHICTSPFLNLLCNHFKDFLDCIIIFTLSTVELIPPELLSWEQSPTKCSRKRISLEYIWNGMEWNRIFPLAAQQMSLYVASFNIGNTSDATLDER